MDIQAVLPPYIFKYIYEGHTGFLQSFFFVRAKKGESTHMKNHLQASTQISTATVHITYLKNSVRFSVKAEDIYNI